jgi:NADH:ubiquinone oxidoreductase subunit E
VSDAPTGRQRTGEQVPRFAHGSRVPGWDDAVDLDKDPATVPDLATTAVPRELRAEIEGHMAKYPDHRSAAIPALAAVQHRYGWCTPEGIEQAAAVMGLTPGYLVSVATFYDMLETAPVGKHTIYVCTNISCSLCGADELLDAMARETDGDPDFNVRGFECLGACDIAPMASVDGVYVGPIALDEVDVLVAQVRAGDPPLPARQLRLRASADPDANTRDFTPAVPAPQLATAGAAQPVRPAGEGTFGTPQPQERPGPPAPIEQAPSSPAEAGDASQSEDGAT